MLFSNKYFACYFYPMIRTRKKRRTTIITSSTKLETKPFYWWHPTANKYSVGQRWKWVWIIALIMVSIYGQYWWTNQMVYIEPAIQAPLQHRPPLAPPPAIMIIVSLDHSPTLPIQTMQKIVCQHRILVRIVLVRWPVLPAPILVSISVSAANRRTLANPI